MPAPTSAADHTVRRYKIRLNPLESGTPAFASWIVFDVIGDTTIILWRHATLDDFGKWWDHPVLSSKVPVQRAGQIREHIGAAEPLTAP